VKVLNNRFILRVSQMLISRRRGISLTGLALLAVAGGCSTDAPMPTGLTSLASASLNQSQGRGVFQRYVAIGTSLSMGWQSDGVVAATQATSWPAQLAAMGSRVLEQPYIGGTGCPAPLAAPLVLLARISGEPLLAPPGTLACSPLRAGVTLPVDNVAISGALTSDALTKTPETSGEPASGGLYHRVLEPGHTQVSTMIEANPKLVSVELGGADVLRAVSGVAVPGASIVPFTVWQPLYDRVLDNVQATTKMAVLVGLAGDTRNFPAFRTGNELWVDRLEFAAVNIAVSPDCNGSPNWLFLPFKLPPALVAAAQLAAQHLGPFVLSCAASANPLAQDFILTPAELAIVTAQIQAMNASIQAEASSRGFAYFSLGALYDRADLKAPFSLSVLLQSPAPFGPLISLDGVHPSAAGSLILAKAAAHALNVTYNLGIPE
jgi:hypothetical protein